MTAEHYFQAAKYFKTNPKYAEQIRVAPTPKMAKALGQSRTHPIRGDWEDVKEAFMREAVMEIFKSHERIRKILLATGDQLLIEDAPTDYYWGCGRTGTGKNRLEHILMEVRATLKEQE
jgi:hypothetical protein